MADVQPPDPTFGPADRWADSRALAKLTSMDLTDLHYALEVLIGRKGLPAWLSSELFWLKGLCNTEIQLRAVGPRKREG